MPFTNDTPFWNLLQTLAWIFIADRQLVEAAGQSASDSIRYKMTPIGDGGGEEMVEVPAYRVNVMSLHLEAEGRATRYPSLAAARDALLDELKASRVTAIGLANNQGDPRPIPATFWLDATFTFEPETAGPRKIYRTGSSRWFDLHFPREQILNQWPPLDASDRPDRPDTPPRLSLLVLARRWLAEQSGTGLTPDDVAVDLVLAAEQGAFTSKPVGEGANPPAYDARLDHVVHTVDQQGEPQGPHWIRNYVTAGIPGGEHGRRLTAARDLSVDLPAVAAWLATDGGAEWARLRGLTTPGLLFTADRSSPQAGEPVVSLASDETKCRQWLLGLMKQSGPEKAKARYREQALREWQISIAGFNRSWAWAIEETGNIAWKKPGRKSTRANRFAN